MTKRELVERLPGLTRDHLYYYERRGWVVPKGQGARRQYSPEQIKLIERVWNYQQQGLRPERAYERACADLKIKPKD